MEVQRDGSLEKGSVDLALPSTNNARVTGNSIDVTSSINHHTISYNESNE